MHVVCLIWPDILRGNEKRAVARVEGVDNHNFFININQKVRTCMDNESLELRETERERDHNI